MVLCDLLLRLDPEGGDANALNNASEIDNSSDSRHSFTESFDQSLIHFLILTILQVPFGTQLTPQKLTSECTVSSP